MWTGLQRMSCCPEESGGGVGEQSVTFFRCSGIILLVLIRCFPLVFVLVIVVGKKIRRS